MKKEGLVFFNVYLFPFLELERIKIKCTISAHIHDKRTKYLFSRPGGHDEC